MAHIESEQERHLQEESAHILSQHTRKNANVLISKKMIVAAAKSIENITKTLATKNVAKRQGTKSKIFAIT